MKKIIGLSVLLVSTFAFSYGPSTEVTHHEHQLLKRKCSIDINCIVEKSSLISVVKTIEFNRFNEAGELTGDSKRYEREVNEYIFQTANGEKRYTVNEPIDELEEACVDITLPENQWNTGEHCETLACQQQYQQQQLPEGMGVINTCLDEDYEPFIKY